MKTIFYILIIQNPKLCSLFQAKQAFLDNNSPQVDLGRIELPPQQCECRVIPLDHRPNVSSIISYLKILSKILLLFYKNYCIK